MKTPESGKSEYETRSEDSQTVDRRLSHQIKDRSSEFLWGFRIPLFKMHYGTHADGCSAPQLERNDVSLMGKAHEHD